MQKIVPLCSLMTVFMIGSMAAHADPVAPDAGQTMRELQKQPELTPPKATEPLKTEAEASKKAADADGARIDIKAIQVSGSSVFTAGDLEKLVTHWVGVEHNLSELNEAAASITMFYRQHGFLLARAYLPTQDIKDGVLTINIMEGIIGQININNQSRVSDKIIHAQLNQVKSGDILQATVVDRALLLLNDTPGISSTRASLQPGASVGTSDLLIELDPTKPYAANLVLDNYGNRYTGEYRLDGALALNSPLKIGDQLNVRSIVSNEGMGYVRLAYQLPVGEEGLKLGGAYSFTSYKLGKEFAALQAHGTASSSSLYATYPFIRSQSTNLFETLTWEQKTLSDKTDVLVTSTDKQVRLVNLGLSGNHQDMYWGGGVTAFDASLVTGILNMDAVSLAIDSVSAKSNGKFTKLGYNLNRMQRITDKDILSLTINGQQAYKNLNSSEKFSLGGANGVRAYPQGEGSGDQGWLANLEVRHNLKDNLQGIAFYDAGSVVVSHTPFSMTSNSRSISGAGIGMNAQYKNMQLKTSLAWRINGGQAQSEPASVNRNPRLWVQAGGAF